ncbi:MAG: alcohol dehydrogenase catalytic domain-containing protein [Thaumarchaeota archaeon]|nr:alcohol dehydrogenase catalytic domain-containing protein [Nitrososphaerota archaeon]MBT4676159.1 alcohol dehydrogenase catalytic domain-containing protein [Nitrososphaerota archaeon]MBT5238110.1 alcohol dehydrogenase catalytic domain-containing protein [Nitrososphaerota archaeon]MBT5993386.1 alcohol dehydrogenase catalytic domain-containing protein [Nitrososphaerota archaeon]MBT7824177.1 alcohol dehydrogenase catalytic domain-containing protein [Nitrososphaerota archaeon]
MKEMMRAMVLSECKKIEDKPLKLTNIEKHSINNPDEVLIKIEACGVCHSQLHGIEGDWQEIGIPSSFPTVPGHEVVGKIIEIGNKVTKFRIGDRVGITPLLKSCMDCRYCDEGKEYLCEDNEITGETLRGGYTEFINASENFLTKVPESMSSEYAAPLFCPGITAYKAVKAAEPEKNKKIAIYGIGGVGHMAIQFAKVEGCEVTGVSRKKDHLNVAEKLGAEKTFQFTESQDVFLNKVKSNYGLFDAAIVFAPSDIVTDTAIKSVKKGGTVIIATVGKIPNFLAFEEKTVRGTLIGSMKDMEKVIEIAQKNNFKVVTESFPLEQANEVLERLKNSNIEARAVLIP